MRIMREIGLCLFRRGRGAADRLRAPGGPRRVDHRADGRRRRRGVGREAGDPFGPWRELADRFQERGIGFGSRACGDRERSEEHTSELQSLMRISYAVFCLKKKKTKDKSNSN